MPPTISNSFTTISIIPAAQFSAVAGIALAITSIPALMKIREDRHTRNFMKPGHCAKLRNCCLHRLRDLYPMTDADVAHLREQTPEYRERLRIHMAARIASGEPFTFMALMRIKDGEPSIEERRGGLILRTLPSR